jgi:acetyl esterase
VKPLNNWRYDLQRSLDPEIKEILRTLRETGSPPFAELRPAEIRTRISKLYEAMPAAPEVGAIEDVEIPSTAEALPARRFRAESQPATGSILYFHAGGWVGGSIDDSEALCRALVVASGCDVLSVGYRLAPEHPFPAAVDDADAALRWLLNDEPDGRIVLLGDGAGGNLAAVLARHSQERGESPRIALQVLIYPIVDCAMDTSSYAEHTSRLIVNNLDMRWFWELYAPDPEVRRSPDASPLRARQLTGLPPALILVAERDPVRDEGLAYARRLVESGVEVTIDDYPGLIHGFFALVGVLGAADSAVEAVSATIATFLAR